MRNIDVCNEGPATVSEAVGKLPFCCYGNQQSPRRWCKIERQRRRPLDVSAQSRGGHILIRHFYIPSPSHVSAWSVTFDELRTLINAKCLNYPVVLRPRSRSENYHRHAVPKCFRLSSPLGITPTTLIMNSRFILYLCLLYDPHWKHRLRP